MGVWESEREGPGAGLAVRRGDWYRRTGEPGVGASAGVDGRECFIAERSGGGARDE